MEKRNRAGQLVRRFGSWGEVVLKWGEYPNKRPALLIDSADGESLFVASVNLQGEDIAADEIAIKDWSENEGVLDWLIEQKIVEAPHRWLASGYVNVDVCKLLVKPGERL